MAARASHAAGWDGSQQLGIFGFESDGQPKKEVGARGGGASHPLDPARPDPPRMGSISLEQSLELLTAKLIHQLAPLVANPQRGLFLCEVGHWAGGSLGG